MRRKDEMSERDHLRERRRRPEVMPRIAIPTRFSTWKECRDYYALEAIFLGQLYDRNKTAANKRRYREAAAKALEADERMRKR